MITNPEMKRFARDMRKRMTAAEVKLWGMLRGKQLEGRKFRRQHVIGAYILDFYCPSEKLAVELDGEPHNNPAGYDVDHVRDTFFAEKGIRVLRFENKCLRINPETVLQEIRENFGWFGDESGA